MKRCDKDDVVRPLICTGNCLELEAHSRVIFTGRPRNKVRKQQQNKTDRLGRHIISATKSKSSGVVPSTMSPRVWIYSFLLSLQYGAQPLISKRFTRREVIVTSSVLTCEIVKVVSALILMAKHGTLKKLKKVCAQWSLIGSLTASGLPAMIYALQNSLLQISYKNLDSLTFSVLNQTKIFFTALFTYIILRYVAVVGGL